MADTTNTASADAVIARLTTAGLSTRDAALIASAWIYQNIGQIQRVFTYGAAFSATDPGCVDSFAQTFAHKDWVDGQDVVAAGASSTDEGFNSRLHKIQNDIAALGSEIAKIYTCMADMRANLAARLEEIATELNRIDADLPTPVAKPPPNWPWKFSGVVENSNFVGLTQLNNQAVSVWKTDAGTLLLPAVTPAAVDPSTDPHVQNASALSKFASDASVQSAFAGKPFSVTDFVAKYGTQVLPTGAKISDVVASLPTTAQFANVNDFVTAVGEQQAATLRSTAGVPEVLANTLQLNVSGAAFATASVDSISTLSAAQKVALKTAGIASVGDLAGADPAKVADAYTKAGLAGITAGDIAASKTTAGIIAKIR